MSSYDLDDTKYVMPQFTGRNILIFSDGTGQAGGILFDEARSNVYKLYRATRCGPDSTIDPDNQVAFYDPGLGSQRGGERIKIGFLRKIYNVISSATGLGISENIIDCYSALIQLWRPGDRIFLFGFSRGAYTVRCLGGVLSLCGIPTKQSDGSSLRRDNDNVRSIAKEAIKNVYRHGSGAGVDEVDDQKKRDQQKARKATLEEQRALLGSQFRTKYSSSNDEGMANAIPHFIGVWDTVAAVGVSPPAWAMIRLALAGIGIAMAVTAAWSTSDKTVIEMTWHTLAWSLAIAASVYVAYIALRVKLATGLTGIPWYKTIHLTSFKMKFFDKSLNRRVRYARHALAIDEYRADFDRVPWINDGKPANREKEEGAWFKQYWFAGNHSDIGGSYPENESRLSDIALQWMAIEAKKAGLLVNDSYLKLFGRANGPQHDECRVGIEILGMNFKWREATRKMVDNATIHQSVADKFKVDAVNVYDVEKPYRPRLLENHKGFRMLYASKQHWTATDTRLPGMHVNAVRAGEKLGYPKDRWPGKELLASRLASILDLPVAKVELGTADGFANEVAISHISSCESYQLGSDDNLITSSYPAELHDSLTKLSATLPFLAWIGANDHNYQKDSNFIVEKVGDNTRIIVIDFEFAFEWLNSPESIGDVRAIEPRWATFASKELIAKSLASIEALAESQIELCCLGCPGINAETAQALYQRTKLVRAIMQQKNWL